jgi:hypothetical protein
MSEVGFEPTIPVFQQAKTVHALDRAATVICIHITDNLKLYTLFQSQSYFEISFIINVYNGFATCPLLLEAVRITVQVGN